MFSYVILRSSSTNSSTYSTTGTGKTAFSSGNPGGSNTGNAIELTGRSKISVQDGVQIQLDRITHSDIESGHGDPEASSSVKRSISL